MGISAFKCPVAKWVVDPDGNAKLSGRSGIKVTLRFLIFCEESLDAKYFLYGFDLPYRFSLH
jgi:hypothetical protein